MNFYIGSGLKNWELVCYYAQKLREQGWKQTYDWTKHVHAASGDLRNYAELEQQGIANADVVLILLPAGRGAHVELGMALAQHKKVFLCASGDEEWSGESTVAFYELPSVVKLAGTADENITAILNSAEKKDPEGVKPYWKLVRDRIPEIIQASGKKCETETLSDADYQLMLDAKLDEELAEYHQDQNLEELADILEVLHAAARARGYTIEELEQLRREKAEKRGGFEQKILLKSVSG